jgi:hypothetical protein
MFNIRKLVVLEVPHGQESNQLIQHVHFDSYCFENNAVFLNPKFLWFSKTIESSKVSNIVALFLTKALIRKILIKFKIASYKNFYAPNNKNNFRISYITYVKGWYFRSPENYAKHWDFYYSKFVQTLQKEDCFEKSYPLKIALHIRRGDYEFFQEGRYFLDDSQYIKALKNVLTDIKEPFKIFVFGNDPKLNRELYMSLGYDIYFSDGTIYQDYYRMSKCQLLIGPSSTFSIWAQYISNGVMKKIVIDKFNYDQVRINDAL